MLEIPAHTHEDRREKEEWKALTEAGAKGGAAVARTAFESCSASESLSAAALAANFSSPQCAAGHATTAHRGDAQWLIRRSPPPPSCEIQKLAAWRRRLLRPGQHG